MSQAITLLLSRDESLRETVDSVVQTIENLCLETGPDLSWAESVLEQDHVALVLAHVHCEEDIAATASLVQAISQAGQPISTIAICDEDRGQWKLSLLQQGVADFLVRPLDLSRLEFLIQDRTLRARFSLRQQAQVSDAPSPGAQALGPNGDFLYDPREMASMIEDVQTVAPQDTTILITGETGTGKTQLARLIHDLSNRKSNPFQTVHCGAMPPTLMESEMFGHVRGAFTGADRDRQGKFAEAKQGTIFFDDVDNLPLQCQIKLLRALEEKVFEPIGSNEMLPVEARIIAASNKDLPQLVADKEFREDLFYRLNVVEFHLAPLRERPGLLPVLSRKFVQSYAEKNGRDVTEISAEAMLALKRHSWKGNIRELRNVIERAVALARGNVIQLSDLPMEMREEYESPSSMSALSASPTLNQTRDLAERDRILQALEANGHNKKKTASELGISRPTLYKKLKQYGLD